MLELKKGWFHIKGVTEGPRTVEEQMLGLGPALEEATGKTVADFGTAEGCIALEFAKAGARSVYACDSNEDLIEVAKSEQEKAGVVGQLVRFEHKNVIQLIEDERQSGEIWQYDIVLALAVIHKLPDPAEAAKFCCESARSLIVVRLPLGSTGVIRSKHYSGTVCDLREVFAENGFKRERKEEGPRGEWVHYYRRSLSG